MKVEAGDVVIVDFTGKIKGGDIIDSSNPEIAKKLGREGRPLVVVVGKGNLIKGLEEAIIGSEKGESKTVEIPPEKAYGERNLGLVRVVPLTAFKNAGIDPKPGMVVDVDGYPARVLSVSGGRVQVDFNHELAGKTLVFDITIKDIIKDEKEKVKALTEKYFNNAKTNVGKEITVEIDANTAGKGYLERKASCLKELMSLGKPVKWIEIYKYQ